MSTESTLDFADIKTKENGGESLLLSLKTKINLRFNVGFLSRIYENPYKEALEIRKRIYLKSNNGKTRRELSDLYSSMAYFYLFREKFDVAAEHAKKGLETDVTQTWMINNLALAYLYMGQYEKAKQIFSDIKDKTHPWSSRYKTYKEATFECLDELKAAGIVHPDMGKVRTLLQE